MVLYHCLACHVVYVFNLFDITKHNKCLPENRTCDVCGTRSMIQQLDMGLLNQEVGNGPQ